MTKLKSVVLLIAICAALAAISPEPACGQSWLETGINRGAPKVRLAAPAFPAQGSDANLTGLTAEFNQVLWNDLNNAGIFEMVSKSYYPLKTPTDPGSLVLADWTAPQVAAQMLVFGKTEQVNGNLVIYAYLDDVQNAANPTVLPPKRFVATPNEISARQTAHTLANEIIKALGGGIPGINLSRIAFVGKRTGHDEIWTMDYDGFNQHPITSYGSFALTPRWAPDDTKLAFTNYVSGDPQISVYSFETHHLLPFAHYKALNTTPSWSPDGKKIAFCSSMSGDPEVYVANPDGSDLQRLTYSPGVDISPVWNPKTGSEIAFVSDRSGAPQIYIMNADGSNLRRLITGGGDASSPSWSPNGTFMAFSWRVTDTGTYDVYVVDIASGRIVQLTHDAGRNEHPSWSPDGRHLVFESNRSGKLEIWTMLADGASPKQLTAVGTNWNPNWSN
ncbi:MAG: Tol-Pal system beta propeller repeat protein TolB [Terriglobia bacterium]